MLPPFPIREVLPLTRKIFKKPAKLMVQVDPSLERYLDASRIEETPLDYSMLGLANSVLMGALVFFAVFSLAIFAGRALQFFGFAVIGSVVFALLTLGYWMAYPRVQANKRAEMIEKELLFALRDVSVEMDAGMSFVDALELVTDGYGALSEEAELVLKDIRLGTPTEEALEKSMHRNVSQLYKSAVLRIVSGMRSGADIPTLLSVVIDNLTEEAQAQVKSYGQEINLWATLYLILGIVLPSMGLTLMVMLSSFTGLTFSTGFVIAATLLLLIFHASAIGLLRSRRPPMEV